MGITMDISWILQSGNWTIPFGLIVPERWPLLWSKNRCLEWNNGIFLVPTNYLLTGAVVCFRSTSKASYLALRRDRDRERDSVLPNFEGSYKQTVPSGYQRVPPVSTVADGRPTAVADRERVPGRPVARQASAVVASAASTTDRHFARQVSVGERTQVCPVETSHKTILLVRGKSKSTQESMLLRLHKRFLPLSLFRKFCLFLSLY